MVDSLLLIYIKNNQLAITIVSQGEVSKELVGNLIRLSFFKGIRPLPASPECGIFQRAEKGAQRQGLFHPHRRNH